jgi:hypothetical protein
MGNRRRRRRQGVHQQKREHISEYWSDLSQPDLHRVDTAWIAVNKSPVLSGIEGKHVKITGRIEMYKGKPEIRINAASQLAVE